ncbi:MAG: lipid-A-disaccharide synthase N-terminal domain-containing protein [Candidatus Anstonellaceae archaeon]
MQEWIGIIGLSLILFGWLLELKKSLAQKKPKVPLKFSLIYACGSLLLFIYSAILGDPIFALLNIFAFLIAGANAYFWLKARKR